MLELLTSMGNQQPKHSNLIGDLKTIVSNVNESCFIQATLEIQPFKPHFQLEKKDRLLEIV